MYNDDEVKEFSYILNVITLIVIPLREHMEMNTYWN